jgi:hypothetical protein
MSPPYLITATNNSDGIKISWDADNIDKTNLAHYYLIINNISNNLTYIKDISNEVRNSVNTNNIIDYTWNNDDSDGPQMDVKYNLTINRIPDDLSSDDDFPKASNTTNITRNLPYKQDNIDYNCNYNTVKSDFFNNLKGKKFNIYL